MRPEFEAEESVDGSTEKLLSDIKLLLKHKIGCQNEEKVDC